MVGHRGTLRPVLGHKVKEEPVDRISSSWESARGETEFEWPWPDALYLWAGCAAAGVIVGGIVAILGWA